MLKEERVAALKRLAKRDPYVKHVMFKWRPDKNHPAIRWTRPDLDTFREYQEYYRNKLGQKSKRSIHRSKKSKRSVQRSKKSKRSVQRSKKSKRSRYN
jgi:hypothetical protein